MPRRDSSHARKRKADELDDDPETQAELMFGPAGTELPVLSEITYNVKQNLTNMTEVLSLNGAQIKLNVKLSGNDIISGLKTLYRSGVVPKPYPKHIQKMASLGKSEVKVKVNCSPDVPSTASSND
ncbi:uncharacterized protein LOC122370514 [Amphibalanus amphitrite]|nr:uncharacterized protein LOC122364615 [Amphibalanus amphitrite]XP_043202107.1 uncharacterized protein LOC122370514 [Amphibalanus amphitrite]XP_043202108.1 uncharacterized protein LOC122370514 [Amphibalanus amphitrite]